MAPLSSSVMLGLLLLLSFFCSSLADTLFAAFADETTGNDLTCADPTFFYDALSQKCRACDSSNTLFFTPRTDNSNLSDVAQGCTCLPGYTMGEYVDADCENGECEPFTCTATCSGATPATSVMGDLRYSPFSGDDGGDRYADQVCVPCSATDGATYLSATKDCECAQPATTGSATVAVRTLRLEEVYDPLDGSPTEKKCSACPKGSAVIYPDILNDQASVPARHVTVGVTYYPDLYTCQYCPDKNMFFNENFECVCDAANSYKQVGGSGAGSVRCIKDDPTVPLDGDFTYYSVMESPDAALTQTTVRASVTETSLYSYAAATCERLPGLGKDAQEACNALGNLCVLHLYDDEAAPCRQFKQLMQFRGNIVSDISDWKIGMPWLMYSDPPEQTRTSRDIEMEVSFDDSVEGLYPLLRYKLAKYTVEGEFLGFEDLSTQLSDFCDSPVPLTKYGGAGAGGTTDFLNFGHNVRTQTRCDLELLAKETMYMYDLYVVDEGATNCAGYVTGGLCLHPVPVLHRNLIENGEFPNANIDKAGEVNNIFTRRFFLFDNKSGLTTNGLEVLRYAKRIILSVSIQIEETSKIYPPILTIEYVERQPSSWADRNADPPDETAELMAIDGLIFNASYYMDTAGFWTNVNVLIGFVSAIAGVFWIIRVRNWQNRNQRLGVAQAEGQESGTMYLVHLSMMFVHTFVLVFFPFVFAISAYWFVFFKLQATVFVLMPEDYYYYTSENEYFFYIVMFHVLFWGQTFYVLYLIYKQCNSDIFFVDWEKPKDKRQDVSIWRTIMVANEWNEMQTRRKTSLEFSLFWIGFFLIGLNLKNNATMQPDIKNLSDGQISPVLRFCATTWWFFVAWALQWIWHFIFYERYYREPRSQIFIDLCTMAKVSVFVMDEPYHGYYLHCRSPYEYADGSMTQLAEQLKKEESGLTTDRGLDAPGAPRDCQTFELFTSPTFRGKFDKVYTALNQSNSAALAQDTGRLGHMVGRAGGKGRAPPPERVVQALRELNNFLQSFVEQNPPPQKEELKRIVREPPFFDQIFGNPPADIRANNARCIFYPDKKTWLKDNSFLKVTFMGVELDLWLHNVLTFNIFDMAFNDTATSILLTYLVHLLLVSLRASFGQGNLATKTLVDDRFLI